MQLKFRLLQKIFFAVLIVSLYAVAAHYFLTKWSTRKPEYETRFQTDRPFFQHIQSELSEGKLWIGPYNRIGIFKSPNSGEEYLVQAQGGYLIFSQDDQPVTQFTRCYCTTAGASARSHISRIVSDNFYEHIFLFVAFDSEWGYIEHN